MSTETVASPKVADIVIIFILFALVPVPALAVPAKTLDEYVVRIDTALNAGAPYNGLAATIDPRNIMRAGLEVLTTALVSASEGDPLDFVEMFRRQSRPDGAVIIGVIMHGDNVVMFIALVLARLEDGWITVNLSGKPRYKDLLVYH